MKARKGKFTTTAFFVYCLLAIVALLVWMVVLSGQVKAARKEAASAASQREVAKMAADLGEERIKELMTQQRSSRLEASPQDAIQISADIQKLQKSQDEARSAYTYADERFKSRDELA